MPQFARPQRTKLYSFIFLLVLCSLVFLQPLAALLSLSLVNEHYSHVLVIPVLSGYLLFRERKEILSAPSPSPFTGGLIILSCIALQWLAS